MRPFRLSSAALVPSLVVTAAIGALGCSHFNPRPDHALIRPWSAELSRETPHPPLAARYAKDGHELVYLAVHHENDVHGISLQLVARTFDEQRFDVVLLEGFARARGENPAGMKKLALKDGQDGFFREGETSLSIQRALQQNAMFVGVEPAEQDIAAEILRAGYTRRDLLYFYLVRQIPQFRRQKKLGTPHDSEVFSSYLLDWAQVLRVEPAPSFDDFTGWYRDRNGTVFSSDAVNEETPAPYAGSPLFTQRFSAIIEKIRNDFIVDQIAEAMRTHRRVLIVFGASHWVAQKRALEAMLGAPAVRSLASR